MSLWAVWRKDNSINVTSFCCLGEYVDMGFSHFWGKNKTTELLKAMDWERRLGGGVSAMQCLTFLLPHFPETRTPRPCWTARPPRTIWQGWHRRKCWAARFEVDRRKGWCPGWMDSIGWLELLTVLQGRANLWRDSEIIAGSFFLEQIFSNPSTCSDYLVHLRHKLGSRDVWPDSILVSSLMVTFFHWTPSRKAISDKLDHEYSVFPSVRFHGFWIQWLLATFDQWTFRLAQSW